MSLTINPRADFETFGGAAARIATEVLAPGPFGLFWRRDVAREFQACGESIDLSGTHTTCGVFASACWYWAGRPLAGTRASHIGGALIGTHSWVGAGPEHWIANDGSAHPDVGDIVCYGATMATVHHVELVLEASDDHHILTAHGGDSPTYGELCQAGIQGDPAKIHLANGTVARLGAGPKTLVGIAGWYSARSVAAAEHLEDAAG